MTFLTRWLKSLRNDGRTSRNQPRSGATRFRPRLEGFEDRTVPSTFHVTTTLDGVAGSLRQAVIGASAHPGADTIVVPAGTYKLTLAGAGEDIAATGDLDITGDLKIKGAGAGSTTIDGVGLDRVFQVLGAKADFSGMTIRGGVADNGGGVFADGATVTIDHSTITGNTADVEGGGIFNRIGRLTLSDSTISGNTAALGGGIDDESEEVSGVTLAVNHSTISGNIAQDGGGVFHVFGEMVLAHSEVSNNTSNLGGGIALLKP